MGEPYESVSNYNDGRNYEYGYLIHRILFLSRIKDAAEQGFGFVLIRKVIFDFGSEEEGYYFQCHLSEERF